MFHQHIVAEHRFFFALVPPIRLARQIANAAHWFGDDGRAVAAERLHVTLFILADQFTRAPDLIDRLRIIRGAVAAAPVAVSLDYVSGGARSIALRPQRKIAARSATRWWRHAGRRTSRNDRTMRSARTSRSAIATAIRSASASRRHVDRGRVRADPQPFGPDQAHGAGALAVGRTWRRPAEPVLTGRC